MKADFFSGESFRRAPVIGIVRHLLYEEVKDILPLYHSAGLRVIEITMNTPSAGEMINYASKTFGDRLQIGAGTVCSTDDLEAALSCGACFIVTPVINEEVIARCVQRDIPVFAGAYTPTEIYKAWLSGATMVKVFPATQLGPRYIKDVKGPLDNIRLVPTGGINLDNCIAFLQSGATALGVGSQLFDHNLIRDKQWERLLEHFLSFAKKLQAHYALPVS